ncbi:hypothetical protein OG909_28995 [Streptomyces sp. NBC_01754]|uniref:hypothetical protein n=1 Tax=Streptomyces sp. NBC_01754 TaxID=2975930 RepID=UPI002DDC362B|nr:hypothetical protein [Streptomyces sp. NBC_01754]WSC96001.1 hypothetical protein OG909_28995 [Streptomyces sp. NBC_01754]
MSTYQYYEFLAVDRPLTSTQLVEVGRWSTRARITPTSFENEYHWGDFRGDPAHLMERYYDAHLYLADWGTRCVMLRLPALRLPLEAVRPYLGDDSLEAWTHGASTLLRFFHDPEEAYDWDESGEITLSSIVGIRCELASGDLRPLYLAWLVGLAAWELRDDDEEEYQAEREPPVPAGLDRLTGPQQALADFLRLDPDLLAAAAGEGSSPAGAKSGEAALAATAYRERRTAAQLLDAAHTCRTLRGKRQAQERADAERRRQDELAERRATRLAGLAADPEHAWQDIDRLIAQKKATAYGTAVALLEDLRELADRAGDRALYDGRAAALRRAHRNKPALMRRFDTIGVPRTAPGAGLGA